MRVRRAKALEKESRNIAVQPRVKGVVRIDLQRGLKRSLDPIKRNRLETKQRRQRRQVLSLSKRTST